MDVRSYDYELRVNGWTKERQVLHTYAYLQGTLTFEFHPYRQRT